MKIALVNPPYTFWKPGNHYLEQVLGHQPPLGLLSLAGYIRENMPELSITIVDGAAQSLSADQTSDRAVEAAPDVLGITVTTMAAPVAESIAARAKAALPNLKVVVGGPHISGMGEDALKGKEVFYAGVVGEGEHTFAELVRAIREGQPIDETQGIIYACENGAVRRTAPRPFIDDLSSLPPPAWDLLPYFPSAYPPNMFFSPRSPAASLTTSRGCPFTCAFCDQSTFGHRHRAASAEYICEMVENLQKEYGICYFIFADDAFTIDRMRVIELCSMLRKMEHTPAWSCDANVMTVDRELLRAMKSAGCWAISYGLESGSPRILESLKKNTDLSRVREVIRMTHEEGIHAKGLFIMGTPEESAHTAQETRDFIGWLQLSSMNLSKFAPYPGSELHAQIADKYEIDYGRLNGMTFVVPSRHLSIDQLEVEYARTLKRFFNSLPALKFHLPLLLGRWQNIRRLLRIVPNALGTILRQAYGRQPWR
jgi:anaerobic magnesium-protoporphyrin IX monomethyl ester cyclase